MSLSPEAQEVSDQGTKLTPGIAKTPRQGHPVITELGAPGSVAQEGMRDTRTGHPTWEAVTGPQWLGPVPTW